VGLRPRLAAPRADRHGRRAPLARKIGVNPPPRRIVSGTSPTQHRVPAALEPTVPCAGLRHDRA
jgi:hypothetical protein